MARSSPSESLKPGTTSVTTSSQKPMLVDAPDGVQDGAEAATELVIAAVVEALQIHLVQVHPRAEVFEHLGRGVAVGDETGGKPRRARVAEDRHGPFGGDKRLVIGADHRRGALLYGHAGNLLRLDLVEFQRRADIAQAPGS